jgi:hypothetical protein
VHQLVWISLAARTKRAAERDDHSGSLIREFIFLFYGFTNNPFLGKMARALLICALVAAAGEYVQA